MPQNIFFANGLLVVYLHHFIYIFLLFPSIMNLGCKCSPSSASIKSDIFSIREKIFLDCTRGQIVAPTRLTLTCSEDHLGLCWKSCPKCGSTSLSYTFRNRKKVIVENCDFRGFKQFCFSRDQLSNVL